MQKEGYVQKETEKETEREIHAYIFLSRLTLLYDKLLVLNYDVI